MHDLVILDFDGTLADSFTWFIEVLNEVADRFGFARIEPTEVPLLRGRSAREIVRHLGVPAWKLPFIARHMRRLAARDLNRIRLFDGVEAMLAGLAGRGVGVAVVSSNAEDNVRRVLGPANAARVGRFGCGAALFGKARRFRRLARDFGVAPERVLCIGDEIRDAEAAAAAGMAFGAVGWGYTDPAALRALRPAAFFARMDEIAARFGGDPS